MPEHNTEPHRSARSSSVSSTLVIVSTVFSAVIILFFLYLIVEVPRVESGAARLDTVTACIKKNAPAKLNAKLTTQDLYRLNGFCYDDIVSQLKVDEEKIRRDNFVFQRNENVVLLYMVVLITISGVILAGLQLLASYKLALARESDIKEHTELKYSPGGISFRSSVVGLAILGMSFAFFLVFIIYPYQLRDLGSGTGEIINPVQVKKGKALQAVNNVELKKLLTEEKGAYGRVPIKAAVALAPADPNSKAKKKK